MLQTLKNSNMMLEKQNIVVLFIQLIFALHIVASMWLTASNFELWSDNNWIISSGLQDESKINKYIAAVYWATVTCTTVGYGDITPKNQFELVLTIIIIVAGVAYFSWVLSQLATRFKALSDSTFAQNQ